MACPNCGGPMKGESRNDVFGFRCLTCGYLTSRRATLPSGDSSAQLVFWGRAAARLHGGVLLVLVVFYALMGLLVGSSTIFAVANSFSASHPIDGVFALRALMLLVSALYFGFAAFTYKVAKETDIIFGMLIGTVVAAVVGLKLLAPVINNNVAVGPDMASYFAFHLTIAVFTVGLIIVDSIF
jgi:hypothetical protein